jgi:hypothetical protein
MFYIYVYAFGFFKNFQKNSNPEALCFIGFSALPFDIVGIRGPQNG